MTTSERFREIEAKYLVSDPDLVADLAAHDHLSPGTHVQARATVLHLDDYYDTPAYALLRAGYALRLRQTPTGRLLGLKSLLTGQAGASQDRVEVEAALPGETLPAKLERWPGPVAEAVQQILDGDAGFGEWRPIAHIRQVRQKHDVSLPDAPHTALLEFSLDRVGSFPSAPVDGMPPLATWDEAEVELLDASAQGILQEVTSSLQAVDGLLPNRSSKLERALLIDAAHVPGLPGVTGMAPEMPVTEACRSIWREQLIRMLLLEHGVRGGAEPEYVHQMRVAIRRMRAADRIFGEHFRQRALRPHRVGLKQLARLLGAVRDLDVGIANLKRFRKQLEQPQRKAAKTLLDDLRHRHAIARKKLLAHLSSAAYAEFIVEFDRFCRTPGAGAKPVAKQPGLTPIQVRHTLPSIILTRFEHVRAYETLPEQPAPPLATLHALRIEAKYLRYSLEFARPLLGKDGDPLIAQLTQLQDHLGLLNDAQVEQQRLAEWQQQFPNNPAIAARLADLEITTARLVAGYPCLLAQFTGPKNRARLARALTQI